MRINHIPVLLALLGMLTVTADAVGYTAPPVPDFAMDQMPETDSFAEALLQLLENALHSLSKEYHGAILCAVSLIAIVLLVSVSELFSGIPFQISSLAGCAAIGILLMDSTGSMIAMGREVILQISEYGKLLLPVMTAALAAQGAIVSSTALYAGTAVFSAILSSLLSAFLLPMVYCYLALSLGHAAIGEGSLKSMRDLFKNGISWCLKLLLTIFTTYMSITGVVSGTTDAAALKATKVAISTVVPVVGGILSDASEAILVSAGLAKNAAGIYGILVIGAIFLSPFFKIGIRYLILKAAASVCAVFGTKQLADLIADFSSAMGLLLAMTGSACLMQLISTVCFMKGVS